MRFVSDRTRVEWQSSSLSPLLKSIVRDVATYARTRWKWEFTITSIYRTPQEDAALKASGIHAEWRAVDVRTRRRSEAQIADIAEYTNAKWIYDRRRPGLQVCFKEPHGSGPHVHFQVHPRTALRAGTRQTASA